MSTFLYVFYFPSTMLGQEKWVIYLHVVAFCGAFLLCLSVHITIFYTMSLPTSLGRRRS